MLQRTSLSERIFMRRISGKTFSLSIVQLTKEKTVDFEDKKTYFPTLSNRMKEETDEVCDCNLPKWRNCLSAGVVLQTKAEQTLWLAANQNVKRRSGGIACPPESFFRRRRSRRSG